MILLLDTHVFLWWREDSPRLGARARAAVADADVAYVSAASAWEIAVKVSLGKLVIPGPPEEAVVESGFSQLPITFAHVNSLAMLPPHHRDPFDRMLVAQAKFEGLTIVTADRKLEPYGTPIIWS